MVVHRSEKEKNAETFLLTENYSLVTGAGTPSAVRTPAPVFENYFDTKRFVDDTARKKTGTVT